MAIIVDKDKKRKDIALSCVVLFVQGGIKDLSISQVAKEANIGKGTFYDYYKNKDALVFEILNILLQAHSKIKEEKIASVHSTRDKVKMFFDFFFNEEDKELRQIYKEYLSITLGTPNEEMVNFQSECINTFSTWLESIIKEGVEKNEIIPESIDLARGLYYFGDGIYINYSTTNNISNLEKEIHFYVDTLFDLLEIKS
ncbi:MAG: TetR family transcriptional regulator [Arcobacter sp.]|nr:MAG: TetR family transcriptional regulator [Arcobacter sp.]